MCAIESGKCAISIEFVPISIGLRATTIGFLPISIGFVLISIGLRAISIGLLPITIGKVPLSIVHSQIHKMRLAAPSENGEIADCGSESGKTGTFPIFQTPISLGNVPGATTSSHPPPTRTLSDS